MNKNMSEESHKKIFISHSSKDKQIVDIFVDKLLHLGLQIDPNDVAYTSREETGVGTGEDIRKFIKENISTCDFVFFMISENYKKSEICLNEMGAAWATDRTVIPLVFPNLSFDSIGWLYNVRKGLLLNDPDALDSIFDDNHWNKQNAIQPAIPNNPEGEWITLPTDSMRAYFDLCIIKYFLNVISPNNDMQSKITWLFIRFPEIDLKALGFPQGWETEPLWR